MNLLIFAGVHGSTLLVRSFMDKSPRVLLFLALVAACPNAGTAQWVQYGPPGASGSVSSILKAGAWLFASSPGGGVSRSTNNGLSWQTANNGLTNLNVSSLAAVGNKVFAATAGAGVFASTDGGVSWGPTGPLLDPTNLLISNNIVALATIGTSLFAGPDIYGVFYSPNSGVNWYPAGKGLSLKPVNCFFSKDSLIFAGTLTDGVYRTTDSGKTWSPSNLGGAQLDVRAFASSGGNLFAATFGSGLFVSTNNGDSWHTGNAGLTNSFLLSLATVRLAGGGTTLFAGSAYAGMFTSTDNGTTWVPVTLVLSENTVSAFTVDGSSIYAGTTDGVLVSTDAGIHWKEITAGFTQSTVNSLLLMTGNLLAATTGGVFESSTRGATWTRMNEGLTAPNVNSISAAGTTLIAGTKSNGAYVRAAADSAWKATTLEGLISAVGSCEGTLLASPASYGVYYSQDNGTTWVLGGPGTGIGVSIEGFASSPPYAYAASNGYGLLRSTDDGRHWAPSNSAMKDLHAHACAATDSTVYLSTAAGVFISSDFGVTWSPISNGLENHSVTALAVTGRTLLAGTADGGVYVSADNGSHWRPANAGLPVLSIRSIVTDGQDVYAGTTSSGTCRRPLAELLLSLGVGDRSGTPSGFALGPNYPNPFNPSTRITYTVPEDGFVRLIVYDALGREIERLVDGRMPAGTHTAEWHPSAASGVYFCRIEMNTAGAGSRSFTSVRKMILLR
jgi:hypothetical protein